MALWSRTGARIERVDAAVDGGGTGLHAGVLDRIGALVTAGLGAKGAQPRDDDGARRAPRLAAVRRESSVTDNG